MVVILAPCGGDGQGEAGVDAAAVDEGRCKHRIGRGRSLFCEPVRSRCSRRVSRRLVRVSSA